MKQIVQVARNLRYSVNDDRLVPEIELVITTIEPRYELSGTRMNAVDALETHRLFLAPESARMMAENLVSYADEADAQASPLTLTLVSEVKP